MSGFCSDSHNVLQLIIQSLDILKTLKSPHFSYAHAYVPCVNKIEVVVMCIEEVADCDVNVVATRNYERYT